MISTAFIQTKNNIRENLTTTLAGVVTSSFSLIILGTFLLVYINLIQLTRIVFQQSNYTIILQHDSDQADQDRILSHLQTIWKIGEIQKITSSEARNQLIESFGEVKEILAKLDFPKFPEILEFTLNRSDPLSSDEQDKIRAMAGVNDLIFGRETRDQINTFFTIANFVGVFLIILLLISIVLIIHNSIQIALRLRIKEIEILKILGATAGFIRLPYLLEGIAIAVLSYFISLAAIYFLFKFILAGITYNEATFGLKEMVRFFSFSEIWNIFVLQILIGVVSSYWATKKILDELQA